MGMLCFIGTSYNVLYILFNRLETLCLHALCMEYVYLPAQNSPQPVLFSVGL